ncbi:phosphoribosylformylglycinamidine synthase subunit PurS [bacterium]|nr:phosphoribosylformylglycinamidine synthase subunit PurS [bacterium]
MLKAKVYVSLKKTVVDPQGLAVKNALKSLNYEQEVEEVRVGKLIDIKLNMSDREKAEKIIDRMCKKLLSNPTIEEYNFTLEKAEE